MRRVPHSSRFYREGWDIARVARPPLFLLLLVLRSHPKRSSIREIFIILGAPKNIYFIEVSMTAIFIVILLIVAARYVA